MVALLSGFGTGLGTIFVPPLIILSLAETSSSKFNTTGILIASNSAITRLGTKFLHLIVVFTASEAIALWEVTVTSGTFILKTSGSDALVF